ncbi:MAG: ROK family protein, partial [Staphylococcus equorum]|nr:ROK family protein [Staphylococcus equorum]
MNILVFDLGGTSVKYAIWDGGLKYKNKFKTPNSWDKMQLEMLKLKKIFSKEYKIEGVALSA